MMNKEFADIDQIDSAVKAEEAVHWPDHLEKLIKQNQDALAMTGLLMKMLAGKQHSYPSYIFRKFSFHGAALLLRI